jgi:hypothetical protein
VKSGKRCEERDARRRSGSTTKSGKRGEEREARRRAGSAAKSGKRREEREAPRRVGSTAKSGKRREERETLRSTKDEEAPRNEEWKDALICRPPYRRAGNAEKSEKRHISGRAGRFSQKEWKDAFYGKGILSIS